MPVGLPLPAADVPWPGGVRDGAPARHRHLLGLPAAKGRVGTTVGCTCVHAPSALLGNGTHVYRSRNVLHCRKLRRIGLAQICRSPIHLYAALERPLQVQVARVTGASRFAGSLLNRPDTSLYLWPVAVPPVPPCGFHAPHPTSTPHSALPLSWPQLLYPVLVLATLASVVASQALISGVFSIVRQVGAGQRYTVNVWPTYRTALERCSDVMTEWGCMICSSCATPMSL